MKMKSVHPFLAKPFASLCLAAQVAWLAFAANAAPAPGGPVTTAIYLQHVGPSDKPIFPVVICATKPNDAELALALGDEAPLAGVVTVSQSDLRKSLAGVAGKLAAAKEAGEHKPLGTFKVTITQGKGDAARVLTGDAERFSRALSREALPGVLAVLEKTDAHAAPGSKLQESLAVLKARTGLKEAK